MKLCSYQATDLITSSISTARLTVKSPNPSFSSVFSDLVYQHTTPKMSSQISKKRKFVADGVFRAELNEFFTRELAEEGYSGCDVRVTHARTEVS